MTALLLLQPGCFLKFWGKDEGEDGKPPKEKIYDIYGEVQEITRDRLTIQSKKGPLEFTLTESSIKGGDFGAGATVHVFYKRNEEQGVNEVTMVVEKIK